MRVAIFYTKTGVLQTSFHFISSHGSVHFILSSRDQYHITKSSKSAKMREGQLALLSCNRQTFQTAWGHFKPNSIANITNITVKISSFNIITRTGIHIYHLQSYTEKLLHINEYHHLLCYKICFLF